MDWIAGCLCAASDPAVAAILQGKKTINPEMVAMIEQVRASTNRPQMEITDEV